MIEMVIFQIQESISMSYKMQRRENLKMLISIRKTQCAFQTDKNFQIYS